MQIFIRGNVMAKISAKGLKRLKHCAINGLCTVCLEKIEPADLVRRGAHSACYQRILRMVRSGSYDTRKVVEDGVLREQNQAGRPAKTVADLPEGVK
jgi:hypothetical protein